MLENVPAKICSDLSEKSGLKGKFFVRLSQKHTIAKKKETTNRKSEEKRKK